MEISEEIVDMLKEYQFSMNKTQDMLNFSNKINGHTTSLIQYNQELEDKILLLLNNDKSLYTLYYYFVESLILENFEHAGAIHNHIKNYNAEKIMWEDLSDVDPYIAFEINYNYLKNII